MEYPRWFNRVLRAVGLIGDGEMGDFRARGDLRLRLGRDAGAAVEMLRASFGLTDREASIFNDVVVGLED